WRTRRMGPRKGVGGGGIAVRRDSATTSSAPSARPTSPYRRPAFPSSTGPTSPPSGPSSSTGGRGRSCSATEPTRVTTSGRPGTQSIGMARPRT
ncbi:MAG: hypothetical protein AVDCRST_MAG19-3711, partial [uncultured Thermomicrobiales bacterium]